MRPDGVEVTLLGFDEDLGVSKRVEDLSIEEVVTQSLIEGFDIAVLPGRAPPDEGYVGPDRGDPLPDGLGNELRAGVGPNVGRNAAPEEQYGIGWSGAAPRPSRVAAPHPP